MRLKSAVWVAAYLRRCQHEGAFALVERRGAEEAGAIFIKVVADREDVGVLGPAPQTEADETGLRRFVAIRTGIVESEADAYLARQRNFDPDLWIVAVEDRAGRHFLTPGDELLADPRAE
ncbi:MAG: DUF1491 family protein [Flavobacteriaceae bacterium]